MLDKPSLPNCLLCRHYYITWDEAFPYGCRALGFKSRVLPMVEVRQASGSPCIAFSAKDGVAADKMRADNQKG